MANEMHDHVWVIDTAGADLIVSETQLIRGIRFVGTQSGDECVIENGDGEVVFHATLGDDLVDDASSLHLRLRGGFAVPTLSADCTVYLYGQLV